MTIKRLTPDVSVAPQIRPEDVASLAEQGFKSIVSNRPEGESADQPSFSAIEAEAQTHGLEARQVPIVSGRLTEADVASFREALDQLPGPVLAYCRSGTRSATVWALAEAGRLPLEDILSATADAGYDLSGMAPYIASRGE